MSYTSDELLQMQEKHVMHTYNRDLLLVRGNVSYVWDDKGNRYLDFTMGISVCNLGHCHPRVTQAICEQAAKLVHVSNLFYNENQPLLANYLASMSFGGKLFFCNSGAEANEGMIKFARRWGNAHGGRNQIICMDNSFHGRTLATLAATGRSKYRKGFEPDVEGFVFATFNDLASVEALIGPQTTAIMLEPVQGEGGILPATPEFIQGVRALCDKHNLLMLCDEVQCGMGRTGHYFAYQHYDIEPDAMSMAKALGNGLPLAAFEVRQQYGDVLTPGTHASTFGGTPLACAAGIAVCQTMMEEKVMDQVARSSSYIFGKLKELQERHPAIREVRGKGLMIGIDLGDKVKEVFAACRQNRFLVLTAGETVLRLMPSLLVNQAEMDEALAILDKVIP